MEDDDHLIIKRSIFKETFEKSSLGRDAMGRIQVGCDCEGTDCSGKGTFKIPNEGQNERTGGETDGDYRSLAPTFPG